MPGAIWNLALEIAAVGVMSCKEVSVWTSVGSSGLWGSVLEYSTRTACIDGQTGKCTVADIAVELVFIVHTLSPHVAAWRKRENLLAAGNGRLCCF